MKKVLLVSALFIMTITRVALADDMSHKKAAEKMLEVTNSRQTLDQMRTSISAIMDKQFAAMNLPPEGKEAAEAVKKDMMTWWSEYLSWEKMKDMYTSLYVEAFTEQEINELVKFYQSPLGQKMLKKMPEITQKTTQKIQAVLQEKMPEFEKKLQSSVAELKRKFKGKDHPAKKSSGR